MRILHQWVAVLVRSHPLEGFLAVDSSSITRISKFPVDLVADCKEYGKGVDLIACGVKGLAFHAY